MSCKKMLFIKDMSLLPLTPIYPILRGIALDAIEAKLDGKSAGLNVILHKL